MDLLHLSTKEEEDVVVLVCYLAVLVLSVLCYPPPEVLLKASVALLPQLYRCVCVVYSVITKKAQNINRLI